MRVSLNWLKELIDITMPVDELAHQLTMLGLEIESVERPGEEIREVYVGQIVSIEPHPDADKLVVCKTDVGGAEPITIVCGAKNMKAGDKVPTAVVGASLPGGFEIGKRKMRGIESQGMMCSARELGMGEEHAGLLILDPATKVGESILPVLGLDDIIVEIEVTPNRGDWAGMIGVARELSALLKTPYRVPETGLIESGRPASELSSVTIENPDLCPRYIGRVLTNVKIGPSPDWMARRLTQAGMRPINNIVDVTNYVLLETGHPLHAFDYDKLSENRIVVRTARAGETMKTLDGELRTLNPDMLVIADAKDPVAVAGVMGGLDSEVGETTTNLFLESAYFLPASVRKTARTLALVTEASQRFQRGADPVMARYAVDRAAALMREVAGGEVAPGAIDAHPKPMGAIEVSLRYDRTALLLGAEVDHAEQRDILKRLGFEILEAGDTSFSVRVPTWRHDVRLEADLIEEVARLHGYGNIPERVPAVRPMDTKIAPEETALQRLREYLVSMGLTETMNMSFSSYDELKRARLDGEMVTLQNPLAETQSTMRSSLIPGLLSTVSLNVRRGNHNLAVFEVGPVYHPKAGETLPEQEARATVVLSGYGVDKHWSRPLQPLDFYDIKGYAEAVLDFFGLTPAFAPLDSPTFTADQSGSVEVDGRRVGILGRVTDAVLKAFDIEQPVYMLELHLKSILSAQAAAAQFEAIPKFPSSMRDLAVLVDAEVPAGTLLDTAKRSGGKLLKRVKIFDIYTGKQVPAGKKSVALGLVFQSEERTLTDADTQGASDAILAELRKEHGAQLR
ncbi:MAG: phenylalanine--tRNA ligase subunit beta [FCB group bacterium]|jgi:phenylalanyl-tRNA synthetase beta chain|nr:phenylalanine--tRNA ligase subunit beta [FCB group bacterium]